MIKTLDFDYTIPAVRRHFENEMRRNLQLHQGNLANVVNEILTEIDNMRLRKVPEDLINKKSLQVDRLIDMNNAADDLVTLQRLQLMQLKLENMELWKLLDQCINANQVTDELLKYVHEARAQRK